MDRGGTKRASSQSALMWRGHMITVIFSEAEEESVCCVWVHAHAQILFLHTNVDACLYCVCLCVCLKEIRSESGGLWFP